MSKKEVLVGVVGIVIMVIVGFVSYDFGRSSAFDSVAFSGLSGNNITPELQEKIITVAKKHIVDNSAEGIKYFMEVSKVKDGFVIFSINPLDSGIDWAQLVIDIRDGNPKVIGFGSALPDISEKYPGLID